MGTLTLSVYRSVCIFLRLFLFPFLPPIKMASNEGLKQAFLNFANQGKSGAKVQELDNKNWTKMAKDCGLYNKTCTSTDGDITFQKYCELIVRKGAPVSQGTKVATGNNVDRMTDTTQYTGAHKERFDESGKGKGIEGREDTH